MRTRVQLEEMGEIVCKQINEDKNVPKTNSAYSLGEKFLPQTAVEKKFYGTLEHREDIGDYVDNLAGEDKFQEVPAKPGFYQLSKTEGFFSKDNRAKLYDEYKKAEDNIYNEYTALKAKY